MDQTENWWNLYANELDEVAGKDELGLLQRTSSYNLLLVTFLATLLRSCLSARELDQLRILTFSDQIQM